mgnify:CR=1 FL=1
MKFYKPCITISLLFILLSGCSSSKPTENVSANDEVRQAVTEVSDINSYSDTLRVKSVYILASEINPALFLPYDEFETKSDYSKRITEQKVLMDEVVDVTLQKLDIKKNQRMQLSQEKQGQRIERIEKKIVESSTTFEYSPTLLGRYDAEKETFPFLLHDMQFQILVPIADAKTFKENLNSVKVKGVKQLSPKYDMKIKVQNAHIRSRPNGSTIGIVKNGSYFEHIQDEDEWYKIYYKGQYGYTHKNNGDLILTDISDEHEYSNLVAIHPNTGTEYDVVSVTKLIKAPLDLASSKN